ncbi:MAG TPA: ABC transporter permease [Gemmatimonadaceae bacterium]|jgi:ABC-type multidrug transport system permease subunit
MSNSETATRRFGIFSDSLVQLSSVRFKEFIREPEALFWTFAFPIILAIGLGIAFRNRPAEVVHIGVVGPSAEATRVANAARSDSGLAVEVLSADSARVALRTGRVALLVLPQADGQVQYQFDETRPDARNARLLANDAIQRGFGRGDPVRISETHVRERGSRYIDFVVPGLLGMNIMGSSIWGLGYTIVDARRKKLLKRLVATPMSRVEFLVSYLISRIALLVGEVVVLLGFAALFFGVPLRGSVVQLTLIILVSTFAFGGLGLLIASRARTIEGASGLMNVTMMPMWVLSGVFFSSENFPRAFQPLIQALPLTATNNALRASMLRGAGWSVVGPEIALLGAWTVATLWLALRFFRWR